MSELSSEGAVVEVRLCRECGRPLRRRGTTKADYPGTLLEQTKDTCSTCYQKPKPAPVVQDTSCYGTRPVVSWLPDVLGPLTAGGRTEAPSTPNPYTCPCGYQVITHTTVEASRHHAQLVRQHARKCGQ